MEPRQVEDCILRAVADVDPDQFVPFASMTDLRNRLAGIGKSAGTSSLTVLCEAIICLVDEGLLLSRKYDGRAVPIPFDPQHQNDVTYQNAFFNQGQFQLKLTHEGRRRLGGAPAEVPVGEDFDDKMAGLYRAKHFLPHLEAVMAEAFRSGQPLAVLMVDVDKFGSFNNAHGHLVGDEVLKAISEVVCKRIRGKGTGYRFGGDEVTVILRNFDSSEAVAVAEGLRRSIEGSAMGSRGLSATVSVGIACFPEHAKEAKELVDCADKAAYRAKSLGRNLVRVYGEPETVVTPRRETPRRQPTAGGLTEMDVRLIREAYFRDGRSPSCPRDGFGLRTKEIRSAGLHGTTLIVHCPECGLSEVLEPPV
jgi:diguanylate cyclase (GGDEF)-like protein